MAATPTPNHIFTNAYGLTANGDGTYTINAGTSTATTVYDNIDNSYTQNGKTYADSKAQLGDVLGDEFTVNNTGLGVAEAGYHGDLPDGAIVAYVPFAPQAAGTKFFLFSDTAETQGAIITPSYEAPYNIACFVTGTLIRTSRGDVAVEALAVGDLAVTASGAHRSIRWLGHRHIDLAHRPRPEEAQPIRITANAFGDNRPARDLIVSPGHAICVDVLGEVLIPACALVNDSTIRQVEVDEVTYWHVELDEHDVILAENLPTESYIDMGNRGFFEESDVVDLHAGPDGDAAGHTLEDYCRPFHANGVFVEAVCQQLRVRAKELGWHLRHDDLGDLHLVADGTRIAPIRQGMSVCFALPPDAGDLWLVSTAARPGDVGLEFDPRTLGTKLAALTVIDGFKTTAVALDDRRLETGFSDVERAGDAIWRWTNGRARLPADLWADSLGPRLLRVDLAGPALPRWVDGADVASASEATAPVRVAS